MKAILKQFLKNSIMKNETCGLSILADDYKMFCSNYELDYLESCYYDEKGQFIMPKNENYALTYSQVEHLVYELAYLYYVKKETNVDKLFKLVDDIISSKTHFDIAIYLTTYFVETTKDDKYLFKYKDINLNEKNFVTSEAEDFANIGCLYYSLKCNEICKISGGGCNAVKKWEMTEKEKNSDFITELKKEFNR